MPIKVTCACGQSFAANDALAGKRVKCPKCAQPLQIPGGAAAPAASRPAAAPAQQAVAQQAARPATQPASRPAPQPAAPAGGIDSLFDEAGLKSQNVAGPSCPSCRAPMPQGAILCIQCGYNAKLGRQMQTVNMSSPAGFAGPAAGGGGHGGHGDVAATLMERAARAIEEEAESERSKTSEGFPWYGYLGMLIGALLFMTAMRFIPHDNAIRISALVIAFIASMVNLYANIRIWIAAFKESVVQGLLVLFAPCYILYYVITRWDEVGGYFIMAFISNIVASLAQVGGAFAGGAMEGQDGVFIAPRPAYVVVEASPVLSGPPIYIQS